MWIRRGETPGLGRAALAVCLLGLWGLQAAASPGEAVPEALRPGRRRARVDTTADVPAVVSVQTVLSGRVWYEDHRAVGRHRDRGDLDGRPGRFRRGRKDRRQDFLGAFHMQVDVFEQDAAFSKGRACRSLEHVGRTTVASDGSFSLPVPQHDACPAEASEGPRYVVQVSTQYCEGPICVRIGRRPGRPHALWFGLETPLVLGSAGEVANQLLFQPARSEAPSVEAMAANHFASLTDAVWRVHVDGGVPFGLDTFGPVDVRFPSMWSSGRATSAALIDADSKGWPKGNLLLHEYGHIVHRRAWNGDYAGYPNPVQAWNPVRHSRELPFIALKEGWAIFLANDVLGRCDRPRYDTRHDLHSEAQGLNGLFFPQNHHYLLCDLVDARQDLPGETVDDVIDLTLYELWSLLDQTDDRLAEYPHHDPVAEGLDVCDLMEVYILSHGHGEPAATESALRAAYGVLAVNDIWCPRLVKRFAELPLPVEQAAAPAVDAAEPSAAQAAPGP